MAEFNQNIMKWVEYDNQIKSKNEEIKEIRSRKDTLEGSILEFIQNNNLEDNLFNISSMDTQLSMNKTTVKETISYKFLESTLLKYFDNDSEKSNDLLTFIKNHRTSSDKICLKRK
tara:strand:+ start:533 stop:880 length:348 start_codon:yes stop_codon:yes gene_type:complete